MQSPFGPTAEDSARLSKAIRWSVAVHVLLLVAVIATPGSWWKRESENRTVMKISLGGSAGQSTTGMTSAGGRTVEQVAPPPKRPEPIRPTPEKPPAPVPVAKPTPKPAAPKPAENPAPAPPVAARPPVTGAQVTQGSTTVETGASGQGAGLTFKKGIGGGETDLSNFCCPEYLNQMLSTIDGRWTKRPPGEDRGTTLLKFTINRDGSIDNILVETGSGSGVLDRNSRAALLGLRLPPLPPDYSNPTLTVHLEFPYGQR